MMLTFAEDVAAVAHLVLADPRLMDSQSSTAVSTNSKSLIDSEMMEARLY